MRHIYLDENFSKFIAQGLNSFERAEGLIEVHSILELVEQGASDLEVINAILPKKGFLISIDDDFKRKRALTEVIEKHKLGWFFYRGGNNPHWVRVKHIVNCWEKIRNKVLKNSTKRPFCYHIQSNGNFRDENMIS